MIRDRKFWLGFGILALSLIITRLIASYVLPAYDDSFITMRYARNFATGIGLVFNPGEWVLGLTCPAFGMIEALFFHLGLDLPTAVLWFNISCDALILYMLWSYFLCQEKWDIAVIASVLFIGSPILARICIGRMEADLFVLCSIGALFLYVQGREWWSVILATFCFFLRPEGVLLVGILCLYTFITGRRFHSVLLACVSLLIVAVPLYLINHYYGGIIPQSVIAKSHWHGESLFSPLKALLFNNPFSILLSPFAILGAVHSWKERDIFCMLLLSWIVLYIAVYLISNPLVYPWYSEPVQIVLALFASIGICYGISRLRVAEKINWRSTLLPLSVAVLMVSGWSLIGWRSGKSVVITTVYQKLADLGEKERLKGKTIFAGDIGAIGYYTNSYIYDYDGLTWPAAVGVSPKKLVEQYNPDYLFLIRSHELLRDNEVRKEYDVARVYGPIGIIDTLNAPHWEQDYILLRRKGS